MKRLGLTPHLVAATLFLAMAAGGSLAAQEMMASPATAKSAKRADELLKRYDRNGDGKIDEDERADAKEAMMKEQVDRQMERMAKMPGGLEKFREQALAMFDANRDGRLDEDERAKAQAFAEKRRDGAISDPEFLPRFDENKDGQLDLSERVKVDAYLGELRALRDVGIREIVLRRFDRNANGRIDAGEVAALERFVRESVQTNAVAIRRYDKNNDAALDDGEWSAGWARMWSWLNLGEKPETTVFASGEVEAIRLDLVMSEVFHRRRERGAATGDAGSPPRQPADMPPVNIRTAEEELARLKAAEEQVAQRRRAREAAREAAGLPK